MISDDAVQSYYCDLCGEVFDASEDFVSHQRDIHNICGCVAGVTASASYPNVDQYHSVTRQFSFRIRVADPHGQDQPRTLKLDCVKSTTGKLVIKISAVRESRREESLANEVSSAIKESHQEESLVKECELDVKSSNEEKSSAQAKATRKNDSSSYCHVTDSSRITCTTCDMPFPCLTALMSHLKSAHFLKTSQLRSIRKQAKSSLVQVRPVLQLCNGGNGYSTETSCPVQEPSPSDAAIASSSQLPQKLPSDTLCSKSGPTKSCRSLELAVNGDEEFLCSKCDIVFTGADECRKHIVEAHVAPSSNSNRMFVEAAADTIGSIKYSELMTEMQQQDDCASMSDADSVHDDNVCTEEAWVNYDGGGVSLPFRCSLCRQRFAEKTDLFAHSASEHQKRVIYECSSCDKTFVHRIALTKHLQAMHPKPKRKPAFLDIFEKQAHKCTFCSKQFHNESAFRRHVSTHTGEPFYTCDVCQEKFKSQAVFALHKAEHQGAEAKFRCEICKKKFPYKSLLERHAQSHIAKGTLSCPHCSKVFLIKSVLTKHILLEHSGMDLFACPQCDKKFQFASFLERHLVSHTQSKDHACPVCLKAFGLRNHLLTHLEAHFPDKKKQNAKKLQCPRCERSYMLESKFQRHLLTSHPDYLQDGLLVDRCVLTSRTGDDCCVIVDAEPQSVPADVVFDEIAGNGSFQKKSAGATPSKRTLSAARRECDAAAKQELNVETEPVDAPFTFSPLSPSCYLAKM